jgi:hypothetical protein
MMVVSTSADKRDAELHLRAVGGEAYYSSRPVLIWIWQRFCGCAVQSAVQSADGGKPTKGPGVPK